MLSLLTTATCDCALGTHMYSVFTVKYNMQRFRAPPLTKT